MTRDRGRIGVELDVGAGARAPETARPSPAVPNESRAFRIAVIGDLSGGARAAAPRAPAQPLRVDRDSVSDAIARLAPSVAVPIGSGERTLRLRSLDDFHADHLYEQVAAAIGDDPDDDARETMTPAPRDVLEAILAGTPSPPVRLASSATDAERIARALRILLRAPRFRALEASWRAVDRLTRRIETDADLTIELIDLDAESLAASALDSASPAGLSRVLNSAVDADSAQRPWSLLVGLCAFGDSEQDARTLAAIAACARQLGAPFVAGAAPVLAGASAFAADADPDDWTAEPAPAWRALRASPDAEWIALAMPELLLRLPYGADSNPLDAVAFEEIAGVPSRDDYLWGCAAIAVAESCADAFMRGDVRAAVLGESEVGDLPLHIYKADGEARATPPTGVALSDRAASRMLERGLVPLVWRRDSDAARLEGVRSIATSPAPIPLRS